MEPTFGSYGVQNINLEKVLSFFNTPVLLIILLAFFAFYCAVSMVLVYHWRTYGMRNTGVFAAETLYFFVSAVLFFVSILTIYYI